MLDLLTSRGYPKLNRDQIVQMLPDLWKKLEAEGLLKDLVARGFNYKHFVEIALQQKMQAEMFDRMDSFVRKE